jgi:CHASE3 domain sensor protein
MSYIQHPNSTPSSFRSKLGSYCTGLAIGCILMGFFFYQKHRSQQRSQQQNQHVDQITDTPNPPTGLAP